MVEQLHGGAETLALLSSNAKDASRITVNSHTWPRPWRINARTTDKGVAKATRYSLVPLLISNMRPSEGVNEGVGREFDSPHRLSRSQVFA